MTPARLLGSGSVLTQSCPRPVPILSPA